MADEHHRHAEALSRHWDALTAGEPAPDPGALEADEAAFIAYLVSQARRAQIPAGARERARRELPRQFAQAQREQRNGGTPMVNGITAFPAPFAPPRRRGHARPSATRRPGTLHTILSYTGTIALIAAMLAMIFFIYQDGRNHAIVPPLQETPTAVASPAGDWPIFRGNPARTGEMPGPGLPDQPALLWQYTANAPTRLSPVLADGTLFLSPDGEEFTALDPKTGSVRWQIATVGGPIGAGNGIVFAQSPDASELVAHDTVTSEELWRVTPGNGFWSPLVVGDTLYYGGDPNLFVAYDAKTGAVRWKSAAEGSGSRAAALADGVLVVGTDEHHVVAADASTGATKWDVDLGGNGTIQTPAILNGVVYIGYFGDATNSFFALDLQTGQQRWRIDGKNGEGFWAPAAANSLVFVPSDGGILYALDATTGEERWTLTAGGPMKSAPAIVDGVVYVAGDEGIVLALDATTGDERWRFQVDGTVTFGPIVAGGVLYVSTGNGKLYALGKAEAIAAPDSPTAAGGTVVAADAPPTPTAAPPVAEFVWAAKGSETDKFAQPLIARLAPDGSLWVSDSSGRFFIFDLDGNLIDVWGSVGRGPGQFVFTQGNDYGGDFAFAADGSLYVADAFNQRVQHFDKNRQLIGTIGSKGAGDGQFQCALMLAIAPDGTVVVVDPYRNDVQRFAADGTFLGRFDGTGTPGGQLSWPNSIAIAADGTFWIGDFDHKQVRHFTPDGQELGTVDVAASQPDSFLDLGDVVIDANGNIYVADQQHNTVKIFAPDGRFVAQFGGGGSDPGKFIRPNGIAVNRGGTVYVADGRNARVQKFKLAQPLPAPIGTPVS